MAFIESQNSWNMGRPTGMRMPFPPPPIRMPFDNKNWSNFNPIRGLPPQRQQFRQQYYNLQPRTNSTTFQCESCNRYFFSNDQFQEHVKQHINCPFPGCKLEADEKVIDRHISHQHLMVNFDDIQIDDETWINNRKKRFPSIRRAELRSAQQTEKRKRGEKLGLMKPSYIDQTENKFFEDIDELTKREEPATLDYTESKEEDEDEKIVLPEFAILLKDDNSNKNLSTNQSLSTSTGRKAEPRNDTGNFRDHYNRSRPRPPFSTNKKLDLFDSDSESRNGIPTFKGTKLFYESTGELSLFGVVKNVSDDHKERETFDISDDEFDIVLRQNEDKKDSSTGTIILHNALGSLITAYDETDSDPETNPTENPSLKANKDEIDKNNEQSVDKSSDTTRSHRRRNVKRKRHHHGNKSNGEKTENNKPPAKKPCKPKIRRRRPYLLERLLAPEIRHERNVILQCIRFIVEKDFFDVDKLKV